MHFFKRRSSDRPRRPSQSEQLDELLRGASKIRQLYQRKELTFEEATNLLSALKNKYRTFF